MGILCITKNGVLYNYSSSYMIFMRDFGAILKPRYYRIKALSHRGRESTYQNQVWEILVTQYTNFFYKQPVFKQLALQWQIAKQHSWLSPFSLSNNKNYRLKKIGVYALQ